MKLKDSVKTAAIGLKTNKSRSILTILGIVIGIAAIMMMMSIGKGAENLILSQISSLGAETIIIRPGQEPTGPTDIAEVLFADSLGQKEVEALRKKSNVPDVVEVMPLVLVPGSVSYGSETFRPTTIGGSAEFMAEIFDVRLKEGILFDETDIRQRASVAVIGSKVKDELFGESDAIGNSIRIKDRKFRVIGVFQEKGQAVFFNFDEVVMVPPTSAQSYLLGIDYFHEIILRAKSAEVVDQTVADIEILLRQMHGIDDPEKDDFFVVTQQGAVEQVGAIIGALTIFLSSVVAIALVVGGIGVMNIMLVSVTERIKEIGLRKAVGATNRDILRQFLIEAVVLTSIGGLIGIILGGILSFLIAIALKTFTDLDWVFIFPLSAAIIGLIVSAGVGLIFGIYPARQAAHKNPIDALRYE